MSDERPEAPAENPDLLEALEPATPPVKQRVDPLFLVIGMVAMMVLLGALLSGSWSEPIATYGGWIFGAFVVAGIGSFVAGKLMNLRRLRSFGAGMMIPVGVVMFGLLLLWGTCLIAYR
jgi:hypothetical protein